MSQNNVSLFGLLPVTHRDEVLHSQLESWLEPLEEADQPDHPYRTILQSSDGEQREESVETLDEIRRLSKSATSGHIGTGREDDGLKYGTLPFSLHVYRDEGEFFVTPMQHVSIPWHYVAEDSDDGAQNAELTVDLATEAFLGSDTLYLYGFASFETNPLGDPDLHPTQEVIHEGEVTDLHWLNIFPPAVVDQFGRERLLSTPAHRVEELEDGSVLLVVQEFPVEKNVDRWLVVRDHLGLLD